MIRPIQYLRAVAALMVVWVHALYIIPGAAQQFNAPNFGGAGVDLFFVISGFIMVVTTAEKRTDAGGVLLPTHRPHRAALLVGDARHDPWCGVRGFV